MKFAGKCITALLITLIALLVAGYFLLQTRWGADKVSAWISEHTGYSLRLGSITYRWSTPDHLILNNITLGLKGKNTSLTAERADIGLSTRQFSEPFHVDSLQLEKGVITLSSTSSPLPLKAERLQLMEMAINSEQPGQSIQAKNVNGGLTPWLPEGQNLAGTLAQIQLSAGTLTVNGIPASNVLVQGDIDHQKITLRTVGADLAQGAITGSLHRDSNGDWTIDMLRFNDIRWQTTQPLPQVITSLQTLPRLSINRLEITDARLEGPQWAVTDLDLSLRNITLENGAWHSDNGQLSMNASDIIYQQIHLLDPIINADLSPQGVVLRQVTSRWEGGMVRTSGQWLRQPGTLALNDVIIAGLEYTLPETWKTLWQQTLPEWLKTFTVKKLSASRNLLIDVNPDFPFQFTALDGDGAGLTLVQNREWGIWSGKLSFTAAAATLNRTDIRRPSITLNASPDTLSISELSAFTENGLLDATASVDQTPARHLNLQLTGKGVPLNILNHWGWPEPPLQGDGNLQLSLQGAIAADKPLATGINATLRVTDQQGHQAEQTMVNGRVPGA